MAQGRPIAPRDMFSRVQIVATRGQFPGGLGGSGNTLVEGRYKARTGKSPVYGLQYLFANRYLQDTAQGEAAGSHDMTVTAALEFLRTAPSTMATLAMRFRGQNSSVLSAGSPRLLTDPLAILLPADSEIYIRCAAAVTGGQQWVGGFEKKTTVDAMVEGSQPTQIYGTGVFGLPSGGANIAATTQGYGGFGPVAVLGVPETPFPSALIVGDSIGKGVNDTSAGDGNGNKGYIEVGLWSVNGHVVPWSNLSKTGDRVIFNDNVGGLSRRDMMDYCSHVIVQEVTNDVVVQTLAVIQPQLAAIWAAAKARGKKVYQCLVMPRTDSSNVALTNFLPGGVRDQLNTWITQQVGTLIDGIIDPNPYVEDPANPGKWLPGLLPSDGTHPTPAGVIAAAPAVTAVAATWTV